MSKEETIGYKFINWLKNQSDKPLPDFYYSEKYAYILAVLHTIIFLTWIFIATNTSILIISTSNIQNFGSTIINLIMNNLFLIITYAITYSILSYLQKRSIVSFKKVKNLRAKILRRDSLNEYLSLFLSILTVLLLAILVGLPYTMFLFDVAGDYSFIYTFHLREVLSLMVSITFVRFLLEKYLGNISNIDEELILIADSLENFDENYKNILSSDLFFDDLYLVKKFVDKISEKFLFYSDIIEEINLSNPLNQFILAMFWGTEEEKGLVKDFLYNFKIIYQKGSWRSDLIDWFEKIKISFPRFENLSKDIKIKPKNRSNIVKHLKIIGVLLTIGAFFVGLLNLIISFYF